MKTPFEILGLPDNTPFDEVKHHFRKLSMSKHPDKGGNEKEYQELLSAYMKISCGYKVPEKRKRAYPPKPNKTVVYEYVTVSLDDAMNEKNVNVVIGNRIAVIQIPYGVANGQFVRYNGIGVENKDGVRGNLDVQFTITLPDGFTFENNNGRQVLVYNVKFNGNSIPKKMTIPLCGKKKTIYLPHKMRDGMFLKVVGFGYPKGCDLYVRVGIMK